MKAMKTLLVGATCAAVATVPALVTPPRRDAQPDSANSDATANLKIMMLHGDRVAYRDEGAGEVLLLMHGIGGSSNSWSGVIPLLAKKYRVIAPDLLGHGESDKPRGDYSVGAFAVLLRDLLDALDVTRVTVIGHSLGGGIAMQFAHQHRQYCERIVLISSGGFGGDVGRVLRLLSLPGSELVLPLIVSRPAILAGNALRALMGSSDSFQSKSFAVEPRQQAGIPAHTSRRCRLPRSGGVRLESRCAFMRFCPRLIISGDQDRVIPVEHARAAHRTMPNSRLHIIPGVHHHPPTERPETVARLIDDFVASTGEDTPALPRQAA